MLPIDNKIESIKNDSIAYLSEHKYNLYQQFFIVGIDPKIMFNINKIEIKTIPEPYISPKIISKFPPNDLYYLNIPDNIISSHCFPKGVLDSIIDYNESNYEARLKFQTNFVFSLENQYPEEKQSSLRINRVYFSCLLFYENVENYHECVEYKKKILNNNVDLYNGFAEAKNKGFLIPKVICLSSFKPLFEESYKILESLKKYVDNYLYNKVSKDNFNIYPIEKLIEGLIFNLPALPRSNFTLKLNKENFEPTYIENKNNESINNNEKKENDDLQNNYNDEIIFYETPFNKQPKNIINYSMLMKYFRIKEIFEIIKFILLEEPILFFCEDIHILTYTIEGLISLIYPFEYQYPIVSVLPEENYSFISIFKHFIFGINYKYNDEIFQKKGIILDEKKYIIIVKIEKRFENILNCEEEDKLKYSVITSIISDSNKLLLKIEQDKINENNDNENIQEKRKLMLPLHYLEKCTRRLEKNTADKYKEFANKNKNKKNITLEEKENIFNDEIRNTFIYFFSCILLRYQSFCIKFDKNIEVLNLNDSNSNKSNYYLNSTLITHSKFSSFTESKDFDFFLERKAELEEKYLLNNIKINDIFNCKNFIDDTDTPKLDRPFYKQFFETEVFLNFIKKKIFPNSIQDKLDILYFDYKINEKLTRGSRKIKIETKFFNENLENLSGEININSFKKGPSKKLNEFLKQNNNYKKGINYFQIISKDPNKIYNNKSKNNFDIDSDYETMDTGFCIISLHKIYEEIGSNADEKDGSIKITQKISNVTNDENDDNEDNKNKLSFSYFVFPKLLNDNIFFKENIFIDELENDQIWLNNKNNFNINNCNCLYNQFEKEANIFINKPIIQENYKIYEYDLNAKWKYKYNYEECIKKLWLLYLAKTFHCISFSKKRYYFEEILMFLNDNENKVDQDTILLLFNSINRYGDRNMNQELIMFLHKKNYINILCLREKTKSENNFVKYMNIKEKSNRSETNRGSVTNIPVDTIDKINNSNNIKEVKINQNISRKLLDFYIYSYCSPISNKNKNNVIDLKDENLINLDFDLDDQEINDNNSCGEPLIFNIKDLFHYESNKKYIELKCQKCHKIQNVTIACYYQDDNNKKYQFNFNLISPLALLKEEWFIKNNEINTLFISKEYPEEFLSSLFYFYEQGLPCNFLLPKGISKKELKKELTNTYNNLEPLEDYLNARLLSHKKSFSSLNSPRFKKKDISFTGSINIFDMKKEKDTNKGNGKRKSPSPKKSSLIKRSKFSHKQLKTTEFKVFKGKNVTFSLFKK